ncbi:LacI family transcriptional regulator [Enterococcus sp. DIV0840]|uniref:LacI family DNA-binding transcriptional regulator n=1 Tax=Enterococcus TaxID=1350 RepID=UPI001A8F9479|nr:MULTISPECIES: LacI family DNA-binding transcriptional regulator [Enterococcus]MBO0436079.1 LacI family DNA-binding transcriptional regulator [Enterococcus sp. DIV0849a]MBO0473716.1 LacI family DNA-binding transcriptional regulator [Enterococcus ureasiticus]
MKIRMKDIAKMANVSEAAVSLVLNDKPSRISEKKKQEIKTIAKELNYVPNIAAQSLAKKASQTIGVVIPDIENPFFSKLCKQLEEQFRALGYLTIIVNSNDDFTVEKNLIQMLLNRGVDGLIIALSNESFSFKEEQERFLKEIDAPFVLVDRQVSFTGVNQVYFDSQAGGKISTEYLLENGHQNIAFMTGDFKVPSTLDRINGYKQALESYGVKVREDYIIETGYRFNDGMEKAKELFALPAATAVLTSNDMVAFGVLKQALSSGKSIPEDLSIIGYDRLEMADILGISLATVEQNSSALTEQAVMLLKNILTKQKQKTESIILKPKLFKGESVKKLK